MSGAETKDVNSERTVVVGGPPVVSAALERWCEVAEQKVRFIVGSSSRENIPDLTRQHNPTVVVLAESESDNALPLIPSEIVKVIEEETRPFVLAILNGGVVPVNVWRGWHLREAGATIVLPISELDQRIVGFLSLRQGDYFAARLGLMEKIGKLSKVESLTLTEVEVLTLAAEGYSVKEIARRRNKSAKTVDRQLQDARRKTGCSSTPELIHQFFRTVRIGNPADYAITGFERQK